MNREIKFRAWDKKEKRKFWSVQINGNGTVRYYPEGDPMKYICGEKSDRFELMQYINRQDKNGKEIYEGDIVRGTDTEGRVYIKPVKYNEEFACFDVGIMSYLNLKNSGYFQTEFEVIGNIYENPELL